MQEDDFEETRIEMLGLMADLELGKACSIRLKMIGHRLIFLNWSIEYMGKKLLPDDKQVLLMTVEYYRMKDGFTEILKNKSISRQ